jgi:hypothetical protein
MNATSEKQTSQFVKLTNWIQRWPPADFRIRESRAPGSPEPTRERQSIGYSKWIDIIVSESGPLINYYLLDHIEQCRSQDGHAVIAIVDADYNCDDFRKVTFLKCSGQLTMYPVWRTSDPRSSALVPQALFQYCETEIAN